jgi:hypothetical protein
MGGTLLERGTTWDNAILETHTKAVFVWFGVDGGMEMV